MSSVSLLGRRILVVGASSGIGAAFASAALDHGAQVALCARRVERLELIARDREGGWVVGGDATNHDDMVRVADTAARNMGGLDMMLYTAGFGVLQPLVDTDPEVWTDVFRVNVVGANLATAAVIPHMNRSGLVAYVSSRTTADANALFASYSASKAALDQCIRVWRVEHPDRRFLRVTMGNTQPTEFSDHMNLDLLEKALTDWGTQAIPGGMMEVDDVANTMAESFAVALDHPEIDSSELTFDARPPTAD